MIKYDCKGGFSLVEMVVVMIIIAVLASVAIPIFRSQLDRAKWSEGKAIIGTIASSIRVWRAEKQEGYAGALPTSLAEFGFQPNDLSGNYFSFDDFSFKIDSLEPLTFRISANPHTQPEAPQNPPAMTMTTKDNGLTVWSDE